MRTSRLLPAFLISLVCLFAGMGPARAGTFQLEPFGGVIGGDTSFVSAGVNTWVSGTQSTAGTIDYKVVFESAAPSDPPIATGTKFIPAGGMTTPIFFSFAYAAIPPASGDQGYVIVRIIPTAATGVTVAGEYTVILNLTQTAPTLTVSGGSIAEGNAGTALLPFTVKLNKTFPGPFTFTYAGSGGTATAGTDYDATPLNGTIPAGQTEVTVHLPVIGDTALETDETAGIIVSNRSLYVITGAFTSGTILADDLPSGPVPSAVTVTEIPGAGAAGQLSGMQAWFSLDLPAAWTQALTCRVSTRNGTALALQDYRPLSSVQITFAPGEVRKWVVIPLLNGVAGEASEQFFLDVQVVGSQEAAKSAACTIEPFTPALDSLAAGVYRLRFPAGTGQRYVVEESAALTAWTANSGVFTGTGAAIAHLMSGDAARKFFRVSLLPFLPPGTAAVTAP